MIKDLVASISNDEEALVCLSGLGFARSDWPFIKKFGALKLLQSELITAQATEFLAQEGPSVTKRFYGLRVWLDAFYSNGGYLITPISHPTSRLFLSHEAPLVFFGICNPLVIKKRPAVALVGSRKATPAGLHLTKKLTQVLVEHGITIVSGGAYGIDSAAHEAAKSCGGFFVMILGESCKNHSVEYDDKLATLYPFGPLLPTKKYMFVERNRYVASLADAVVIIEGQQKSGTLHTARFAHSLRVPLYVLPGGLQEPQAFVANYLLSHKKAKILLDFNDFARQFSRQKQVVGQGFGEHIKKDKPQEKLPHLLELLRVHHNQLTIDELVALTKRPLLDVQKELLEYELSGKLTKQGGQFVLTA